MPNLTRINKGALEGVNNLKEVDITGSAKLSIAYLNNIGLESLKTSSASVYKDMYALDISGNKLNLADSTSEGKFVKEIKGIIEKNGQTPQYDKYQNIALGKEATGTSSSGGWWLEPSLVVDGDQSAANGGYPLNKGEEVTIDLGSVQKLEDVKIFFESELLKGEKFTLQVADNIDTKEWKNVIVHDEDNKNTDTNYELKLKDVSGRYFRLVANDSGKDTSITEIEIYSKPLEESKLSYNNQRPSVKIDLAEKMSIQKVKTDVDKVDTMTFLTNAYKNAKLLNGEEYSTIAGSEWIEKDYNPTVVPKDTTVSIKDLNNKDVANPMERTSGVYAITYLSSEGAVLGKTQLEIIDVDALVNAIDLAEKFKSENADKLPEESLAKLDTALNSAKEVRAKDFTTLNEVDKATDNILKVLMELDIKVEDKSQLEQLYADALIVKENLDRYNEQGKSEFINALNSAKDVIDNPDATAQDIAKAWNDLAKAMSNLEVSPDKSALQLLVNEYSQIDLSIYTPASAEKFNNIMERAKALIENKNATQEEIDKALEELKASKEELVEKANKDQLRAVIDSVANLVKDEYTQESWTKL